jgi:peptidoglycan L-alanyl-D-glutamate endopeptidase CwlK
MPKFSKTSLKRLEGVHPLLQDLCFKVISSYDFTITYGIRTVAEQQRLVSEGLSRTMASLHLPQADGYAWAVDVAPYPIDWNNLKRFYYLAGRMDQAAQQLLPSGYKLRWGGDWDMDHDFDDQSFMDLLHYELRVDGG